jgi:hypothetical protein
VDLQDTIGEGVLERLPQKPLKGRNQ